jgi:hypothetical protein
MARHHLGGLYLDEVLAGLLKEVGSSETPLQTAMEFIENLPPNIQRDLLCSFIREMREQIRKTATREIADQI